MSNILRELSTAPKPSAVFVYMGKRTPDAPAYCYPETLYFPAHATGVLEPIRDVLVNGLAHRIVLATGSPRRREVWGRVAADIGIPGFEVGDTSGYHEPAGDNSLQVAWDKVKHVVSGMRGQPGSRAAVVASDVITVIGGQTYHKLSRREGFDSDDLQRELTNTVDLFSGPTEVYWILATVMSMPHACWAWAASVRGEFNPIPADEIKAKFEQDLATVRQLPTRLDLLGENIARRFMKPVMYIRDITDILLKNGGLSISEDRMPVLLPDPHKADRLCQQEALLGIFGGLPLRVQRFQQAPIIVPR